MKPLPEIESQGNSGLRWTHGPEFSVPLALNNLTDHVGRNLVSSFAMAGASLHFGGEFTPNNGRSRFRGEAQVGLTPLTLFAPVFPWLTGGLRVGYSERLWESSMGPVSLGPLLQARFFPTIVDFDDGTATPDNKVAFSTLVGAGFEATLQREGSKQYFLSVTCLRGLYHVDDRGTEGRSRFAEPLERAALLAVGLRE